ncbi:MAG: hypothetical protein SGI86_18025 [Deltaproteobacteria bacterium]|nr:hypothetical protein [Deltaproteobacteria bacterium]
MRISIGFAVLVAPLFGMAGCKPKPDDALGPRDSFVILAPVSANPAPRFDGDPVGRNTAPTVERIDNTDARAIPLVRTLNLGFAAEMLRTVYMVQQVLQSEAKAGAPHNTVVRRFANDAVAFIVGVDRPLGPGKGMQLQGSWMGGPVSRPTAVWVGLPSELALDAALAQTVTGRLADVLARTAISGGTLDICTDVTGSQLASAYRMAMEVIGREWRTVEGPRGRLDANAGTDAQKELFASVRENGFIRTPTGALRSAKELLDEPGVAATVFYRMAQNRTLSQSTGPQSFYAPFAAQHIPAGMNPAVVLGSFRNLQAKLLVPWIRSAAAGQKPRDIIDLIELYVRTFPGDKQEILRVFLVTTYGATVLPGGVSMHAEDASTTLSQLSTLAREVADGKRGLRDALSPPGENQP